MKDLLVYLIFPLFVCYIIMRTSVMAYHCNIDSNEPKWFRLHGRRIIWLVTFVINLVVLYTFIFFPILSLYKLPKSPEQIESLANNEICVDSLQTDTDGLKNNNSGRFITHVTLTTYNPVEAQCDSDPLVTADGTKIDLNKLKKGEIKYCAISRNLLPFIPLGSVIEIEGYGLYEVRDTMNKRFSHCIDILQHVGEKNFKKTGVKIIKIK